MSDDGSCLARAIGYRFAPPGTACSARRHNVAVFQHHQKTLSKTQVMLSTVAGIGSVQTRSSDNSISNLARCVLLAGSARGGTSWALKVLDSHPAVCGSHEPFYQLTKNKSLVDLLERLKEGKGTDADAQFLVSSAIKGCIETHKPPFFRKDFLKTPAAIRTAAWMSARACNVLKPAFEYVATGNLTSAHRLVIKNRPFPHLDRVLQAINADAILLLRHPCGVVSSWMRGIKLGVMAADSADPANVWALYSEYLEPVGITPHELSQMSPAGVLAVNWLVDTLIFREYQNSRMRTRMVVYCDLVRNPVEEWTRVFDWLGLSFDPAVEAFLTQSSKPKFNIRSLLGKKYTYFSVQRSEQSPMEAWKKNMSEDQIHEVMEIVRPHFAVDEYWPGSVPNRTLSVAVG